MTDARMDAAVAMDAQNAPTATWKTAQNAVSHSAHTLHRFHGRQEDKRPNTTTSTRPTHEIPDTPHGRKTTYTKTMNFTKETRAMIKGIGLHFHDLPSARSVQPIPEIAEAGQDVFVRIEPTVDDRRVN